MSIAPGCGEWGKRIDLDDRDVRKVGSRYTVFHRACAEEGSIRQRIEELSKRTPEAYARRRAA